MRMRAILFGLLAIQSTSSALSGEDPRNPAYKIGSTMFVRSRKIPLRSGPSTSATQLTLLQGGRTVTILNATLKQEKIKHWQGRWYQVKLNYPRKHESKGVGWIFGTFLVPEEQGPMALVQKADHDFPGKALNAYKWIFREFPDCDHPDCRVDEPDSYSDEFERQIDLLECWSQRKYDQEGTQTVGQLFNESVDAIKNHNTDKLLKIASCNFVFANGYCALDIIGYPLDHESAQMVFSATSDVDWSLRKEKCYKYGDSGEFCLGAQTHFGREYLEFICIDPKRRPNFD